MEYLSHTIYPATPSRRDVTVGITIKPMPSLTLREVYKVKAELDAIAAEMSAHGATV